MPLGDSITQVTCGRANVQDQLEEAGLMDQVDFVGSEPKNNRGCTTQSGTYDSDHEGHSGWLAVDIAADYIATWAADQKPDIVNIHLGTNDAKHHVATEDVLAAYDTILEALRAESPNVKVIVSFFPPARRNAASTQSPS